MLYIQAFTSVRRDRWALWSCDRQSDAVGLCGRWTLWSCDSQSDAVGLCGRVTVSLMPLGFVVVSPSV